MGVTYYAREDSGSANNPALNMTGASSVNVTFVAQDEFGASGDYYLDQPAAGQVDPDTQVAIGGQTFSFVYELTGALPTAKKNGSQQVPDQFEGEQVIIITVQDYPSVGETTRLTFMPNANATQAEMDAFGNGAIDVQAVNTSPSPSAVCFVRGTLIKTPNGYVPVESLNPGATVINSEGEAAILKWVASSQFTLSEMLADPKLRPICIPKGFLGKGQPFADLWVSAQHKVAMSGWVAEMLVAEPEILISAKHMIGHSSHSLSKHTRGVEYYHLLFDRHELIVSNGIVTESLLPGPVALECVGGKARSELEEVFPNWRTDFENLYKSALPVLRGKEALAFMVSMNKLLEETLSSEGEKHRKAA